MIPYNTQDLKTGWMAELVERPLLDLPCPFAGDIQHLAYLLQGMGLVAIKPEIESDYKRLAFVKTVEYPIQFFTS